jgi:hypothetical protein
MKDFWSLSLIGIEMRSTFSRIRFTKKEAHVQLRTVRFENEAASNQDATTWGFARSVPSAD